MKILFLILALTFVFEMPAFAESPTTAIQSPSAVTTPVSALGTSTPLASPLPTVSVATPAAPPQWAQDFIMVAEGLPLIGPYVSKILLYMGILTTILTSLIACLLGVLNTLMGVMSFSGMTEAATDIAKFRDGKIMYWLKFFSIFNAKKPPSP